MVNRLKSVNKNYVCTHTSADGNVALKMCPFALGKFEHGIERGLRCASNWIVRKRRQYIRVGATGSRQRQGYLYLSIVNWLDTAGIVVKLSKSQKLFFLKLHCPKNEQNI